MKKTYIILFGAALLLGSCTRNPETDEPTPPHASSGLVIKASCTPATRTDIIEGKSTWEVGDRITVVYDGTAYVYTATEAGATTTFASDTGITAYDPSKPLTAYYPVTTVEGTVAVEPQRTITLQGTEQTNTACAPLVGTPLDKNLAEGALHVSFRNIFSVIELRIDAGELDSPAQSLAVEPASQEDFDGYLTFTGTVDPSTLALTPAPGGTGSKLTLHFPDNADLTRPQTIKFPVGRFISEAGLKLTRRQNLHKKHLQIGNTHLQREERYLLGPPSRQSALRLRVSGRYRDGRRSHRIRRGSQCGRKSRPLAR